MDNTLKEDIEKLVASSIKDFNLDNSLNPKRIVLFTKSKKKIRDINLIFNYTQNRFFNQQYVIDNPGSVSVIPFYRQDKDKRKGDYVIDVIDFLEKKGFNLDSSFYL